MSTIIYERRTDSGATETYEIDELSQRMLVYLLIDGSKTEGSLQKPIGADSKEEIETRYEKSLGPNAAELVKRQKGNQTLDGGVLIEYTLTKSGEDFVYNHKNSLSMPADLVGLAKTVSRLEVEFSDLRNRMEEVELQLEE